MDSRERTKPDDRRREELLARQLAEALDARRPHDANDCPDPEIIAAFAEQSLGPDESARWEGHFAECSRCRTVLQVLNASADTPLAEKEVARLGELVAAARVPAQGTPAKAQRIRSNQIDWRMRWLAPALGVAAAVAVLLVLRPPRRAAQPSNSETLVAQAPKQELALPPGTSEADRLSRVAPTVREGQNEEKSLAREGSNGSSELNPSARDSSVGALAKERAEAKTKLDAISPRVDEPAPPDDKKLSDVQPSGGLQSPSSLPAVPSPQPPKTAQASPQLQANAAPNAPAAPAPELDSGANAIGAAGSREKQAVMAQSDAAQQSGAGPAKKQSAAESRLNEQKAQAFTLARPIQKDAAFLKAPSGTTLWRAGSSGSIERSLDGGTTWTQQASPTKDDWLAGAAVSDTACWLVGRHGAIARTVDGEHWELIAPPAQAASPNSAPPDWTAVTAIDSQTATITAGDGRKFSTVDGGKAWRPR